MRILHVSSEHPPQQVFGLGRYVCDISRELVRQGHSVHVLTNSIGGKDPDLMVDGVSLHRVDFPPPPKPPGVISPVMAFNLHLQHKAQTLSPEGMGNPEVVVSHDWLTALAGHRVSRILGVPHVWTVHDTVHGKRFGQVKEVGDRMVFEIESWTAKSADLVLVNSRAIRDEVISVYGGIRNRMEILHCAIDPERFVSTQEPSRVQEFRRMFAEPDEILVTYVGRLDLEKGIDTLINAFACFHKEVPKSRLAIVGQGELQEAIEIHIRKLGLEPAARLYGYLRGEVLKHFYIISDIHVCPSHYEPFGIVALEAMAAGTAVVTSATGGLTDIISGRSVGRLFPPRDAKALAQVLLELARDPALRKQLGKAGSERARKHFSWSVMAKKAAACYEKAARSLLVARGQAG
jgi:glycosyltransferase involved in cell wall biosynthesis